MNILHIDSSPRGDSSNSRRLTSYLANALDGNSLVYRDLAANSFPPLAAEDLVALHGSLQQDRDSLRAHLAISQQLITELKNADTLIIGIAIHNFSVPAVLKQWIDYICRAGVTFRYGENGPEGLCNIRRAYLVVASGGTPIGSNIDFASDYVAHICRFIGVDDVHIIDASGSKRTPEQVLAKGREQIDALLATTVEV